MNDHTRDAEEYINDAIKKIQNLSKGKADIEIKHMTFDGDNVIRLFVNDKNLGVFYTYRQVTEALNLLIGFMEAL